MGEGMKWGYLNVEQYIPAYAMDFGIHPVSALNLILSLAIVIYAVRLLRKGRRLDKGMYWVYLMAGLWTSSVYILYLIDLYLYDFMDRYVVRTFCFRPIIFILLCTILAALIRTGWHRDE